MHADRDSRCHESVREKGKTAFSTVEGVAAAVGLALGLVLGLWAGGTFDPRPDLSSITLDAPGLEKVLRAQDLAREGRPEEALRAFGKAEGSEGCRAALLLLQAGTRVESDPNAALEPLGEFLNRWPESWRRWEAVLLVVRALDALGKREEAKETLKTALLFEPKRLKLADRPIGKRGPWPGCTHSAWLELARLSHEDGAYADAKEAAELVPDKSKGEVFRRSPERPAALLIWAKALDARGMERTARAALTELISLFPRSPEAAEAEELLNR